MQHIKLSFLWWKMLSFHSLTSVSLWSLFSLVPKLLTWFDCATQVVASAVLSLAHCLRYKMPQSAAATLDFRFYEYITLFRILTVRWAAGWTCCTAAPTERTARGTARLRLLPSDNSSPSGLQHTSTTLSLTGHQVAYNTQVQLSA